MQQQNKPKCFVLMSGGLDSIIAAKLMQQAGCEVIGLNFVSHFFGGPSQKFEMAVKQLKIKSLFIPIENNQLYVTVNPKYGHGKNFNACIDCHSYMLRIAKSLMSFYGVDIIATGEVLGQRPMSQNKQALQVVREYSGCDDCLIRPLSQKLLQDKGMDIVRKYNLNEEYILDIQGRQTTRQQQYVEQFQLQYVPSHGGGCLLTDPEFGKRMKIFNNDKCILDSNQWVFKAMQSGRLIRMKQGKYCIVGKDNSQNIILQQYTKYCDYIDGVSPGDNDQNLPGPSVLLAEFDTNQQDLIKMHDIQYNNDIEDQTTDNTDCYVCKKISSEIHNKYVSASEELIEFGKQVFNVFCKGKGLKNSNAVLHQQEKQQIIQTKGMTNEEVQQFKKQYLVQ